MPLELLEALLHEQLGGGFRRKEAQEQAIYGSPLASRVEQLPKEPLLLQLGAGGEEPLELLEQLGLLLQPVLLAAHVSVELFDELFFQLSGSLWTAEEQEQVLFGGQLAPRVAQLPKELLLLQLGAGRLAAQLRPRRRQVLWETIVR